ncbi:ANTAR domain-containing protein [Actinoplanes sp. CA-142083]|uniref:ANTAR domain-containing protein n=1 Tax=Actinoplanes sp. CA-142083 TaxID=3239903 RepID=UPI003D91F338
MGFLTLMAYEPFDSLSALAELGRIKLGETDLNGVLQRVAELARRALPGAAEVSVTLVRGERAHTAAQTGETALRLDEYQYEQAAGPCLEAAARHATVSVPHAATDPRWSGWAARAAEAGMGSVLSVGLPILDDVSGALNIYGAAGAFDDDTVALAQTFVGYAAVALANAHRYDTTATLAQHMQAAMASRAVIEQAKGIIMGRRHCTAEEAFTILTQVSQRTNRKLREVAADLVAGVLRGPGPPLT